MDKEDKIITQPVDKEPLLKDEKPKNQRLGKLKTITTCIALAIISSYLIGLIFFFPVKVPTGAMLNTILIGDHVLISRNTSDIKRGDVVVFKYPKDPSVSYIKRIIGLPGESIEIQNQKVLINGKELIEEKILVEQSLDIGASLEVIKTISSPKEASYKVYYSYDDSDIDLEEHIKQSLVSGQKFAVGESFRIPSDQYFVMGDNRDNSQDSRYWGTVPKNNIIGKAWIVYYSTDISEDDNGKRSSGNIILDFFVRNRWSRIGTKIK